MKLRNLFTTVSLSLSAALVLFVPPAFAQVNLYDQPDSAPGPYLGLEYGQYTGLSGSDLRLTVARIINISLGILGAVAVSLIVYAGFVWMTAAGNTENIDKARGILTAAVIGLVIILSAWVITRFVFESLSKATTGGV